jgi:Tfp pilus assembly protein PilX
MRILRGEGGAALITALMLTMLSLVVALALLYTVSAGTRISASQKRYRSALAAAQGGVELATQDIIPRLLQRASFTGMSDLQSDFALINLTLPGYGCLQQKLTVPSAAWSPPCQAQAASDTTAEPDLAFTLGGQPSEPAYSVTMKIVDSVPGNSDTDSIDLLDAGSSVTGREEVIHPRHVPGMYQLSVQGVGRSSHEKARLSLLYAY